jgi:hypothetical protein
MVRQKISAERGFMGALSEHGFPGTGQRTRCMRLNPRYILSPGPAAIELGLPQIAQHHSGLGAASLTTK